MLMEVALRYREANHNQKTIILGQFVASTGYCRKYAIRLLAKPVAPPAVIKRSRPRVYGREVQEAPAITWPAANYVRAKRRAPFIPELTRSVEQHGHLALTDEVRAQLPAISPATAGRLLRALRQAERPQGVSTTKRGTLLKHQAPVRTFAGWNEAQPGFLEGGLVAH